MMRRSKIKNILFLIIVAGGLPFLPGCDHTDLSGTITPSPVTIKPGESIILQLEVPSELEDIHRETWEVEPDSLGWFECLSSDENCREVTFTANTSGTGTISVWGFYKQTNPQFITEASLEVVRQN